MQQRTVDMLLSDLAESVNMADPEQYRLRVNDHIRTVFRRIGYDLVANSYTEQLDVQGHQMQLPAYVLKVDDLSWDGYSWEGYRVTDDMHTRSSLSYTVSPYGLHFPNLAHGQVYVRFLGLPRDQQGQTLIPDEAYEAVHDYTLGKLLEGLFQHPRYAERYVLQQNTDRLIAESRVELAQYGAASRRTTRRVLGNMVLRGDNERGFWNR